MTDTVTRRRLLDGLLGLGALLGVGLATRGALAQAAPSDFDSGEVAIASGVNGIIAHGLGARPRFVACWFSLTSGPPDSKTYPAANWPDPVAAMSILAADDVNVVVTQAYGQVLYAQIFAQR